ncbi:hypothetical protein Ae201684P_006227 [Aphanomyces euteiches]|uniref:Uncharacterized protein n=1 Tax=Aphanomyces euteiches TaxID=100861 RepID=A0A6G0XBV5_9STRA|nr:hypothetical protein Ae201684_006325 [Aphanomyces euteiches]KAH9090823.1 hypothetical protein Ae201684P_006227 [Aphanomyces euteiches]
MSLIVSLEDILKTNGEEHLHHKIMQLFIHAEEEPPVIFGWINVHVFVQAIQQAQAQAAAQGVPLPPSPFPLPVPMTVENFKQALLTCAVTWLSHVQPHHRLVLATAGVADREPQLKDEGVSR